MSIQISPPSHRTSVENASGIHCVDFSKEFVEAIGERYVEQIYSVHRQDVFRLEKWQGPLFRSNTALTELPSSNEVLPSDAVVRQVNGGLIPVAHCLAEQNNLDTSAIFVGVRRAKSLPKPLKLSPLPLSMLPSFAKFVGKHDRGTMRVDSPSVVARVVADLAIVYPTIKIVVLARSKEVVEQVAKDVIPFARYVLNGHVACNHCDNKYQVVDGQQQHQVVCSALETSKNIDVATVDIVLLVDPEICTHVATQLALSTMDGNFRLFAISWSEPANALESVTRMKMLGPARVVVKLHNRVRRHVDVSVVQMRLPKQRGKENDLGRAIWFNKPRNRLIVDVAKGLASGLASGSSNDETCAGDMPSCAPVCILVDNLVQFKKLANLLPDWTLCTGNRKVVSQLPGQLRGRIDQEARQWNTGSKMLVLAEEGYVRSFSGYSCRHLIWAGGGQTTNVIPNSWLFQMDDGSQRPLTIIDFEDRFSRHTQKCAQQRRRDYSRREIFSTGVDPVIGRISEFLKSKCKGGLQ